MITTDTHVYFVSGLYSNWHPCAIDYKLTPYSDPIRFNCSEQIYMAHKALMFNDFTVLQSILEAPHPKEQKELGRNIIGFDQAKWNEMSRSFMMKACVAKFTQHNELARKLIQTGDRTIVEAAWYDTIWGVGLRETDPLILDEANWKGTNWLGKTLMLVREHLHTVKEFAE